MEIRKQIKKGLALSIKELDMKIMTKKKWKQYQEYITTLELKNIKLNEAYEILKKEHEELERKYKRLKMQAFLKGIE